MGQILFAFFPIVLLIYLMVKKNSMPSSRALPLIAGLTYILMLVVFEADPNLVHANVVKGLLLAWTPILIIAGAILLFKTMERTGDLDVLRTWLNGITDHPVAQLMMVGWAFPFLIEGASGFGTPAAIAAPILVGLGFPPVRVAMLTLIMNSVPVSFGAIGTPTWFGFSEIDLSHAEALVVAWKTAILNSAAAVVIPPLALLFVLKPATVFRNLGYILLSTFATTLPFLAIARFNYEFPSLVGGAVGLLISVYLAHRGIGLNREAVQTRAPMERVDRPELRPGRPMESSPGHRHLVKASFPLWGTILILVVTRIPELGMKGWLTAATPAFHIPLGSLGDFFISPSLVVGLTGLFGTAEAWTHSILYVPSVIPFALVSFIALCASGRVRSEGLSLLRETAGRMAGPTQALLGALVFVSLMMMGGTQSAVTLIGDQLAAVTGPAWTLVAAFLGALGSFFSGSATISNLTFGGIQDAIAGSLGLDRTTILALQSAGASMGNMVCINNIVAVASILALGNREGDILKNTVLAMLAYGAVVAFVGSVFL